MGTMAAYVIAYGASVKILDKLLTNYILGLGQNENCSILNAVEEL